MEKITDEQREYVREFKRIAIEAITALLLPSEWLTVLIGTDEEVWLIMNRKAQQFKKEQREREQQQN